jgi:tetratricopeptide (TPR) repeat protein/predicted small secreted protein
MRKHQWFTNAAVLAAALLASCATTMEGGGEPSLEEAIAQSAVEIAAKLPEGTRVAIVAFASPHGNLSDYIMDEVTGVLVDGRLEVADRNNLEYVYKELNFQMYGEVSDETAVSVGKFLGARYVITGELLHIGGRYRYRLNGINTETAVHESSTRLNVRGGRDFERMLAALREAAPVIRSASYGTAAPKTAGTFLDRGIVFAVRGEYDLAVADFSEAIDRDPDLWSAWMLRGRAWYAGASHVTSVGDNFSSLVTTFTTGKKVSEDRKAAYDRAIADFTQAIRLDPYSAMAYVERGDAYNAKGDYDRAIADYSRAIGLDPEDAAAYNDRGLAYVYKGDYDQAIADFSRAIGLDPEYAAAYNNRGLAYYHKEDYDQAIADFSRAIGLDPEYADAYKNRGLAYGDKGDYVRAIADWEQALRLR